MQTLLDAILNKAEVTYEDAKMTVKDCVMEEVDDAKCIKTRHGYSIKSGTKALGKGITKEIAWTDAILKILSL